MLRLADRLEREAVEAGDEQLMRFETMERAHIFKVLQKTHWKINGEGGASSVLGLHPSTLRFRIKKLGIKRP
jgi:formate hydrogenlyase transcriptional activator